MVFPLPHAVDVFSQVALEYGRLTVKQRVLAVVKGAAPVHDQYRILLLPFLARTIAGCVAFGKRRIWTFPNLVLPIL